MGDNHILELFTFFDGLFIISDVKVKSNTITWSNFESKGCKCSWDTTIRIVVVDFNTCCLVFSSLKNPETFQSLSDVICSYSCICITAISRYTYIGDSWATFKSYWNTWEFFSLFPDLVFNWADNICYFKLEDTVWSVISKVSVNRTNFKVILTRCKLHSSFFLNSLSSFVILCTVREANRFNFSVNLV